MDNKFSCPVYKKCGGCQLDVPYDKQLSYKQRMSIKLLGKFCRVSDIIGMEDPLHYRCKVTNAFGYTRGQVIYGIWQSSSGRIVQNNTCALEDPRASKIMHTIKRLLVIHRLGTYNEQTGKGFLRFVTVRIAKDTGEILVALGTGNGKFPTKKDFVTDLVKNHPEITTVTQNISTDNLNLILGKTENILYGDGCITDRLCGCDFKISARSFFQINPTQTEKLYSTAVDFADLTGNERIIDAYCGVGTIGIIASKYAKKATLIEINEDAVQNAVENARLNNAGNVQIICGDSGHYMKKLHQNGENVDVVFTDPPRAGCSKQFLNALLKLSPSKIVYISCNPETLARDLQYLTQNGYKADKIQPVDMFPYTKHVECVALMSNIETEK